MILAACTPKATATVPTQAATESVKEQVDAPTAEPPEKAVQTIRFYESGGAWQSWVEKLALPQFYDKYPHIKIEYEPIDWDGFPNKTLTQMAAGTAPDVLHGWSQIFQAWQSKKQLLDLTPLVEADFPVADLQDQIPFQWDTLVDPWTHERFAIPGYVDSQIIYYNKDMFDEMGLAYPNKNWKYDDYAETSRKLVKKNASEIERWGGWYWYTSWTFNSCHINAFGGKVRDDETWMKSQFHTEETKAAIDWIRKRIWEDKSWINDSQMSGLGISGDSSQLFATGTFGMMEADIEFWPDMAKNVNFKWDIMHLPTGSGGRHALGDNDAWCMYKGTHDRGGDNAVSAAWQWMKFMNSEPFQKLIITQSGNVPARKSVNKEWPAMMRKTFPALADVTLEVIPEAFEMNYLTASEQFRFQADAEPIVTAALEKIWQTGTAGVEILDQVSADIDKSQEAALQKEQS
jgi:multiple sugar transport system substrate-binding protein